jgi:hypothetical protein
MDVLLTQWLDASPVKGDEALRSAIRSALNSWKSLPPAVHIEYAGRIEELQEGMSDSWKASYKAEMDAMEQEWDKMRQAIADKHVTVYEYKNRVTGYVFCGAQNDDRMTIKWIVCGHEKFVEDYKNVQKEFEEKQFNKKYERVFGTTPYREIDQLDEKFKDHCYQRVCKFSAPKHDSGWIKI